MDRSGQLGEEKISKLLVQFSIPAIIGMLVNALYNVVDRIFIGNGVGSLGIAATTIAFPLMIIVLAFGMLIGIGATSLISIKLGEKKQEEAELTMGNAVILLALVSFLITILGLIFLNPLLRIFGASDAVMPYARDYMSIILWGTAFQCLSFGMNGFIRAEGNPKMAMILMLVGAILNIILNPILIFGLHWGIKGSATATIISQLVCMVWTLHYYTSGKSLLKLSLNNLKLCPKMTGSILAIGSAPFAMQIAASLVNMILNNSLNSYGGDVAISSMGIITSIITLILMPVFGINQGVQPIIGFNYGAQKYDRVKEALRIAMVAATVVVSLGFIAVQLIPTQIITMFNSQDTELIKLGTHALRVFLIFLPIIGFQVVGANYFQAIGKPKQAMFLSLSRQVLVLIPALLVLPHFFQLDGVIMAGPVADLISSMITGLYLWKEFQNLDRKQQNNYLAQAVS